MINTLKKLIKKIIKKISPPPKFDKKLEDYNYLISHGVETEYGYVTLLGKPIIKKHPNSRICIGKDVLLISSSEFNSAGVNHPVILATEKEGAEIILGDGCGFSGTSIVSFSSVRIGNRSGCGVNCNIWDSDFHSVESNKRGIDVSPQIAPTVPIVIGEDVWIGANVTVLKGVHIGDRAVISSMSLVNKNIQSDSISAGIPAKKIKDNKL